MGVLVVERASTVDIAAGIRDGLAWFFDMEEETEAALIEVGVASTTGDGPAVALIRLPVTDMVMAWAVNPELRC